MKESSRRRDTVECTTAKWRVASDPRLLRVKECRAGEIKEVERERRQTHGLDEEFSSVAGRLAGLGRTVETIFGLGQSKFR